MPNSGKLNGEVNRQRCGSNEEPFSRRRFGLSQRSRQGIKNGRNREAGVDPRATRADCKGMSLDEKRALRQLMTQVTKRLVDRGCQATMAGSKSNGSAND